MRHSLICNVALACLQEVDALYSSAVQHFPDSALLHVFIAQYLRVYRGNRHLELMHIAAAEVRDDMRPCMALYRWVPKFWTYGSVCCACAQRPSLPRASPFRAGLGHRKHNLFQWVQSLGTRWYMLPCLCRAGYYCFVSCFNSSCLFIFLFAILLQEKDPALDEAFLLYQRRQQLRQEDCLNKSNAGAMSLAARIKFEQSKQATDENGIKARGLQVCVMLDLTYRRVPKFSPYGSVRCACAQRPGVPRACHSG